MAIRIRQLSYSYREHTVLHDLDLDIEGECFTVILGKNGSGKSTLFRIIAGFLPITAGSVDILGVPVPSYSDRERARVLGYLPQHHRPVFPFTVFDVVLTGRAGHVLFMPRVSDKQHAIEAMSRIGIGHLRDRLFTELSGGEQQLVMLARILAQKPRIILLDEPISHLDFSYQAKLMAVIRELVDQDVTIVAILHDPNIATLYGDRFVYLQDGRILTSGQGRLAHTAILEQIYGIPLNAISFMDRHLVMPKT